MNLNRTFFVFLSLLALTLGSDYFLDNYNYHAAEHRRLQKEMDEKFKAADRIQRKLEENNWQLNTVAPDNGILLLAYRNNDLLYWSDNSITFYPFDVRLIDGKRFEFISNGYYVIKSYVKDSVRSYALILVKTQYPYENEFLKSRFQPDLKLPRSTELLTETQPGSFAVHDWEGIYLFSVKFSQKELRFSQIEKRLTPALVFSYPAFLSAFIAWINTAGCKPEDQKYCPLRFGGISGTVPVYPVCLSYSR